MTLQNAQAELMKRRRNGHKPKPIATIAKEYKPGQVWEPAPPPPPSRIYQLTPLAQFTYNHLSKAEAEILRHAIARAHDWLKWYQNAPGLSFVITGPVGTGKTTIAENLMREFKEVIAPGHPGDDDRYYDMIQKIILKMPLDDPNRLQLQDILNQRQKSADDATAAQIDMKGRLMDATDLMSLFTPGQDDNQTIAPLSSTFANARVIVIDDAGTEEISYSNETTEVIKRHRRYRRFMDFAYRNSKHIIVTSMTPLLKNKKLNPEFVNIFGQAAFSRLHQMAKGYMCDLGDLPDYRPFMVKG